MAETLTEVRFSFLTAGPTFRLELPDDFLGLPELSSPLRGGFGAREFVFIPNERDDGMTEEVRVLPPLGDADGRTVEFFERVSDPPQWYLRWPLANGALYTHLRSWEGPGFADVTVRSLSIIESESDGTPFLLAEPPLRSAVVAGRYTERAQFFSTKREGWAIVLERPGFMSVGTAAAAPNYFGSQVVVRAGTRFATDLWLWAGTERSEAADVLAAIVDSLREG